MRWAIDSRVVHPQHPEWGTGKVIGLNPGDSVVVAFSHAPTVPVLAKFLRAAKGRDAARRISLPQSRHTGKVPPLSQYRRAFLDRFPKGFRDRGYLEWIRAYKVDAADYLASELSVGKMRHLLAKGDYEEVCRRAKAAVARTNLLYWVEKAQLTDALKGKGREEVFSRLLFELLHGSGDLALRFGRFADFLVDNKAGRWTAATYFLFLKDPDAHVLVKPKLFQRFADVVGIELNYRQEPNYLTYRHCVSVASLLKEQLRELKPRDLIDVQSFMWWTGRDR